MNNSDQLDQMLKQALSTTLEPSKDLNKKILDQLRENNIMEPVYKKTIYKRRIRYVMIATILTLILSTTAFAAWHFLGSNQVAEHLGDKTLANAFNDKNAIQINKSVASGEYNFTLHGIVSGEGLSDFGGSGQDIHPDRTYAVVSISKQDGSKMPDSQNEEYGKVPFFVSPLIKGQKPWQYNIASMNGGYCEFVMEGVMYRLIECDGVEMFADRGLYLCVSTSNFYDVKAFNYNEETGEISPKTDYKGANALFDLPLDATKADHDKAEKYLKELMEESAADSADSEETDIDWDKELENGVVIPESIKKVTYDADGFACYEYEGTSISTALDGLFEAGQTVANINMSEEKNAEGAVVRTAIQFLKDSDGVITGRVIKLK